MVLPTFSLWKKDNGKKKPLPCDIKIGEETSHVHSRNSIRTTKYNALTFVPRFLFEQFRRFSNLFFLAIIALQQLPGVSPTGRYTTILPLCVITAFSAVKEIYEDLKRARADSKTNRRRALVLKDGHLCETLWRDVRVGNIVKVENNEDFAADLVLLSSSAPQSIAYIETANLDGETNLKIRQARAETAEWNCESRLSRLCGGSVQCEPPSRRLHTFSGSLSWFDGDAQCTVGLGLDQLLMRGARLKNTDWSWGVVVYTGHDTRLMMNSKTAPLKRSNVERKMNHQVLGLFSVLVSISLLSSAFALFWEQQNFETHWYLAASGDSINFAYSMFTFIILYNCLIPISLQVSLEIVRVGQAWFIGVDEDMFDEASGSAAQARTSNLNEELGQVKYLFTDKTGTLTQNVMVLKRCAIGGQLYGSDSAPCLTDERITQALGRRRPTGGEVDFLRALAICHTVVPEDAGSGRIVYHGSSPDEVALVRSARDNGVRFHTRTPDGLILSISCAADVDAVCVQNDVDEYYQVLNVLPFTSDRMRMSVVVRCPDSSIRLYVKGADTVIFERLAEDERHQQATEKCLRIFGTKGYRTLCVATARLEPKAYRHWDKDFAEASVALTDREKRLALVAGLIETKLDLLGATAIEDRLQMGVATTIEALLRARIRVWMLTGDKLETAVNIGHSCGLLEAGMQTLILQKPTADAAQTAIRTYLADIGKLNWRNENNIALIVDGVTLGLALHGDAHADLATLALSCRVVVCCRVSPMQKAEVVELVKQSVGAITLAIGDGANDVAMIQSAHVGVGISGQEGLQAAAAADYTIGQFRFLKKLLFVHGAWSYSRTVKMILFYFYKNVCFYMIQFWYSIYCAWSGQAIFERWSLGLYNMIFTVGPPFALGLFDRLANADKMVEYPQIYTLSQSNSLFRDLVFWEYILTGVLHSALIFFMWFFAHEDSRWGNGRVGGWDMFGCCIFVTGVVVVCVKAALLIDAWTWPVHVCIWGSVASWFVFIPIYSHFWVWRLDVAADVAGMHELIFTSTHFWLALPLVVVVSLLLDFSVTVLRRTIWKTVADEVRELDQKPFFGRLRFPSLKDLTFTRSQSDISLVQQTEHGYAFSQEENGAVSQRELVTLYNSGSEPTSETQSCRPPRLQSPTSTSTTAESSDLSSI